MRCSITTHLPRVEGRARRARLALDEARVTEVREANLEQRAAAAAVDVEEFVALLADHSFKTDARPSLCLRMIVRTPYATNE